MLVDVCLRPTCPSGTAVEMLVAAATGRRPALRILVVCHDNLGWSPLVAALLQSRLGARAPRQFAVSSAGLVAPDQARMEASAAHHARRFGLTVEHVRSRRLVPDVLGGVDLVVTASVAQVGEVQAMDPIAGERTFTLNQLAAAAAFGADQSGQLAGWEWIQARMAGRPRPASYRPTGVDPPVSGLPMSRHTAELVAASVDVVVARLAPLRDLEAAQGMPNARR